jgi:hypothetical protein
MYWLIICSRGLGACLACDVSYLLHTGVFFLGLYFELMSV